MKEGAPQEQNTETQETFVPPEEQARFAELASLGEQHKVEEKELDEQGIKDLHTAAGLSAVAGTLAFSPLAPLAAPTLVAGAVVGGLGVKYRLDSGKEQKKKEEAFDATRTIVTKELRKTGAMQVGGEMRATPEQIELARQEAERAGVDIVRPENVG